MNPISCVTTHIDTSKNTEAWAVSQYLDTSKNTKTWAVSQHTDTSKNTNTWAVSQHIDTSKNTKVWAVSQHINTSKNTKAWAVSQHTDTSKNTKAWAVSQHADTRKEQQGCIRCCYTLYISVKTIFSSLHNTQTQKRLKQTLGPSWILGQIFGVSPFFEGTQLTVNSDKWQYCNYPVAVLGMPGVSGRIRMLIINSRHSGH